MSKQLNYYNIIKKEGIKGILKVAELCSKKGCPANCALERNERCVFASKDEEEWKMWLGLCDAVQKNTEKQDSLN